jgi:hypothetical protein
MRLVFGLCSATTTGLQVMPWPWRAVTAPPVLAALLLPATLLFAIFSLQRVLVMDRALLVRHERQRWLLSVARVVPG